MTQVTHKQHYVWREYLKPWCTIEDRNKSKYKIWWNNSKIIRNTNVFDILMEKDFYEFKPLNNLELFVLKEMFFNKKQDAVIKANKLYEFIANFGRMLNEHHISKEMKDEMINFGEEIQTNTELLGIKAIESLRNGDIIFFKNDDDKIDFLIFILFQYFRTKAMRDNIFNTLEPKKEKLIEYYKKEIDSNYDYSLDWKNVYNYGFHALVNSVLYNYLIKDPKIKLLVSKDNSRFIVCDQPVYNIADNINNDLELFYPISPNMAVLISPSFPENSVENIDDNQVLSYNLKTLSKASTYILGLEEQDVNFHF